MSFKTRDPLVKRWVVKAIRNYGLDPDSTSIKSANLNMIVSSNDPIRYGYKGPEVPYYLTINRRRIQKVVFSDMGKILKRV